MNEPQNTSCFPNDNSKRIDYVLFYKYHNDKNDKEEFIKKYLEMCEKESIIINKDLKQTTQNNETLQYILLHCPLKRLLEQAEKIKLEMRIKDAKLDDSELLNYEIRWIRKIKDFFSRRKPLKKDEKDGKSDIVTMPFQLKMKDLFYGCDDESLENPKGPFSSNTRSLLVHSILNDFITKEESNEDSSQQKHKALNKGIDYLVKNNYFDDAFILHDDSRHFIHLVQIVDNARKLQLKDEKTNEKSKKQKDISKKKVTHDGDVRNELYEYWASFKNIFKTQPLSKIREYFGESVAFYFAWIGTFIWTLILPSIIGFAFFIAGIVISSQKIDKDSIKNLNSTGLRSASIYGDYYLNIFADSFDNDLTPYFALIICVWGTVFSEFWKRENKRLAYEWNVLKFENEEINLPDYELKEERIKTASEDAKFWFYRGRVLKIFLSYTFVLLMVCIICVEIALVALFRIHMRIKVFPNDEVLGIIFGDVGSTVINIIIIMIMNKIYTIVATKLTKWENYRTKTEFDDALIIKLFIFEFFNSYGSLFYMAFFRIIEYENGLFNLGKEYQDKCDDNNCMALLSIQLLVVFIVKPIPLFFGNVILPLLQFGFKKILFFKESEEVGITENLDTIEIKNQNKVLIHLKNEKRKARFDVTISEEYIQKVILYGYLLLFACTFSLGPIFVLLINIIDLRIDGNRLLWIFRRPIGFRAQDIGAWFYIIRFLNIAGIISNAFIIAFTSNWSNSFLGGTLENRLIFVVAYEHIVFSIWLLIIVIFPNTPNIISMRIRAEAKLAKETISKYRDIYCENTATKTNLTINKNLQQESAKVSLSSPEILNAVILDNKPKTVRLEQDLEEKIESTIEINNLNEFKMGDKTRNRKKMTKKYKRLATKIDPMIEHQ